MRRIALVSLLCLAVAGTAKGEGGWTPLHKAALAGTVPFIEALLADGASVNAKAENDATPLHVAAAYGQVPAIEALLDAGALVNAKAENEVAPRCCVGSGRGRPCSPSP